MQKFQKEWYMIETLFS